MEKSRNKSVLWLAGRYLRGQGSGLVGRAHYLTLAGIILGVAALICVSSVMNGFRADIRSRIEGTLSEIRISRPNGSPFADYPGMLNSLQKQGFQASPVVRNELVLKHGPAIFSTLCLGIDPVLHSHISGALVPSGTGGNSTKQGLLAGSIWGPDFSDGGIALGSALAAKLNVLPGDEVQLLSPLFDVPTAFGLLPRVRNLRVAAIFYAGMPEYNESFSYVPLDVARFFSGYAEEVDYIEIRTPDFARSERYARQLRSQLKGFSVEDWSAYDASLFNAIRFEKYMMFVIMLFMYIIASFNLTGNMLKTISQKKRELGLLKAIGYNETDLRDLFIRQSLLLSTLGIALGIALGTLMVLIQKNYGLFRLDMGDADLMPLPVKIMWTDYLTVVAVSYLITLLSVVFPLRRLKGIKPIELIRQNT